MIKILPVSDLHVDFSENFIYLLRTLNMPADVLVISGDLCQLNYKKRERFIRRVLLSRYARIVCIPGNHEFYGKGADDECLRFMHEIIVDEETGHKFEMLNNSYVDIGDIRFIGTCLWSPVTRNIMSVMRGMNDYAYIRGYTVDINNALNAQSVQYLDTQLHMLPRDKRAVVITHHIPLWDFVDESFKHDVLTEAYANNLDRLLRVHNDVITAWFYGHAHQHRYDKVYDIPFVRNPLGYLFCEKSEIELGKTFSF